MIWGYEGPTILQKPKIWPFQRSYKTNLADKHKSDKTGGFHRHKKGISPYDGTSESMNGDKADKCG
jgi:hypothetical protein